MPKKDLIPSVMRLKNPSTQFAEYTTLQVQGPDHSHGLELQFFGNANITSDLDWSNGGGPGSAAVMNINSKPLVLGTANKARLFITATGNVGIGTTQPDELLAVKGKIHAEEVLIDLQVPGPDYVFEEDYELAPLPEVESYIKQNKHLPEIPSAKEMEAEGIRSGEMHMLLLKKVEELTLYVIEQNRMIEEQNRKNETLQALVNKQSERIATLEKQVNK